jgi:hypothetical protein
MAPGPSPNPIPNRGDCFSYEEACRLSQLALRGAGGLARTVTIDLARAADATTAAFARLVLLRRALLRSGRDLRLVGLHGRAAGVYEVNRLGRVLPRE